nr:sortilin-related receptor-like [Leptinotarsa decemlineata]
MYKLLAWLWLVCYTSVSGDFQKDWRTLHGTVDSPDHVINLITFDPTPSNDGFIKINNLHDSHKQLITHWVSGKSKVVICLARDPEPLSTSSSTVFISYDNGDSYINKKESLKMPNGSYAIINKFYCHPRNQTHLIFTDTTYNWIYLTRDYGKTFESQQLKSSPEEVSFYNMDPDTFVVLDKISEMLVSRDFGKRVTNSLDFVNSVYWINHNRKDHLVVQWKGPHNQTNSTSILYTDFSRNGEYSTGVKDMFFVGNYLFTTKVDAKGSLTLFASFTLGKQFECVFETTKKILSYYVVDVSDNRALIVASHSNKSSTLYVSEDLGGINDTIRFTPSLENVFAFFPSISFQNTWLPKVSKNAFVDVYKVQGISGIYIASQQIHQSDDNVLNSENLRSLITFDNGVSWHSIVAPQTNHRGVSTGCVLSQNCSLHLTQKLNELSPDTKTTSIFSSETAPGLILATGVMGNNLEGQRDVYISVDAGLTWRQTLKGSHLYRIGDHGGILVAVEDFKNHALTRVIKYSTDDGEHWKEIIFQNDFMKVYELLSATDESTIFTLFGSLPGKHEWMTVKIDLEIVFNRTCSQNDFTVWFPRQNTDNKYYIPCILGQQITYERKIPHANCRHGLTYVRNISKQSCNCDADDFICDYGFISTDIPHRCILANPLKYYDPYKVPANCRPGHFYNRTKGYQKIAGDLCSGGLESLYMPDIVPCSENDANEFLLIGQRDRISRYNISTDMIEQFPIKSLKNISSVDFDITSDCVYWTYNNTIGQIEKLCLGHNNFTTTQIYRGSNAVVGISLDWISKTLFFIIDGTRTEIQSINVNYISRSPTTILNSTVLKKPTCIVVHPIAGYIFWGDWSADNATINRADSDGSNVKTLFGRDKVEMPSSLTIDYMTNRLYWVDPRRNYIGSSDFQGNGFFKVASVTYPISIAILKNSLYWGSSKSSSISKADKTFFENVETVLKQVSDIMSLKAISSSIQTRNNGCSNSSCPYICVSLPKNNFACLCPNGLILRDGKCVCPDQGQFTCRNYNCLPNVWKCDGSNDCGDNSDEDHCEVPTCPDSSFLCDDRKCIPMMWRCDNNKDCNDGTDEMGCPKHKCTDKEFQCDNGKCIDINLKCNGEKDCPDISDEKNCTSKNFTHCGTHQFTCKSGSCIPLSAKCDLENDCGDFSDEVDCSYETCSEEEVSCGPHQNIPNQCIHKSMICDGFPNCANGEDEVNCSTRTSKSKGSNKTTSTSKSNETNQENLRKTCSKSFMFLCKNQRCIPTFWKCDGSNDCGDNSDEEGC